MYESCNEDKRILYICNYECNYFLTKRNVVAVGLGYKFINGCYTHDKCIKVFTKNKVPTNQLSSRDLIPSYYKGIKTDVVSTGYFNCCGFTNKVRPTPGGYSISPSTITGSGTLGCLVSDGTNSYLLSANHVLSYEGTLPLNTPIVQPGTLYGGTASKDTIAHLAKYVPLQPITTFHSPVNFSDCAIAKLTKKSIATPKIALIGKLKGLRPPQLESHVEKSGSASELTLGQITAIGTSMIINFSKGQYVFKDQLIATKMSEEGDSGALVTDTQAYAIGLLFADSQCHSVFTPISKVLQSLHVTLIT